MTVVKLCNLNLCQHDVFIWIGGHWSLISSHFLINLPCDLEVFFGNDAGHFSIIFITFWPF